MRTNPNAWHCVQTGSSGEKSFYQVLNKMGIYYHLISRILISLVAAGAAYAATVESGTNPNTCKPVPAEKKKTSTRWASCCR